MRLSSLLLSAAALSLSCLPSLVSSTVLVHRFYDNPSQCLDSELYGASVYPVDQCFWNHQDESYQKVSHTAQEATFHHYEDEECTNELADKEYKKDIGVCDATDVATLTLEASPKTFSDEHKKLSFRMFHEDPGASSPACTGDSLTRFRVRTDECTQISYDAVHGWIGFRHYFINDGAAVTRSEFRDAEYANLCETHHESFQYAVGPCLTDRESELGWKEMKVLPYWDTPEEEPVESSSSSSSTGAEDADTGSSSSGGAAGDDSTGSNAASSVNVYGGSMVLFMVAAVYLVL